MSEDQEQVYTDVRQRAEGPSERDRDTRRRSARDVVLVTSIPRGGPIEQAVVLSRELVRRDIRVRAVCGEEALAERFIETGARAAVIPLRRRSDALQAMRIARFAHAADVIHAHDRRSGLWVRLMPRPRSDAVRVYTVHGLPDDYLPWPVGQSRPGLHAALFYRGIDAGLASRADAVTVPSHAVAGDLVTRLGFPRNRVSVIPNGIEIPPATRPRGALIGTLSVLEPVKGLDVFLWAAARLAQTRPDQRFAIFGSGSESAWLNRLAAGLGIAERVDFPGYVNAAVALERLAIFVLPSYAENAPMALLEAMAAGVPVVVSRLQSVLEIVDETCAGLVPPGSPRALADAIAALMDDPELAEAQADAARRRVIERFSADANAEATLALYDRLLARKSA